MEQQAMLMLGAPPGMSLDHTLDKSYFENTNVLLKTFHFYELCVVKGFRDLLI